MVSTGRIVQRPVKIDFHIHSAASAHKDGQKVNGGTVENIDVLFGKLEENEVNMAAITDHDCFDYSIYDALRKKVSDARFLQRVLPGVEFTVSFKTDEGSKPIHIVTLFDDGDEEAVKRIGSAIHFKDGKPDYDDGNAFTEDTYWGIIRDIGLDIVAIAHQKTSPGSGRARNNDANIVGEALYNEFLFVEYFEAYEYKNRRNELFNRSYAYSHDQQERLRFITGSDCHVWSAYPDYDTQPSQADRNYAPTYLKCLPTFKGLAMAVTDLSRIKTVPSFFSGSNSSLDAIEFTLNGVDICIPLSPGINAIIGDNSIGKSSLLNALNEYRGVNAKVKSGQANYLASCGLTLHTRLQQDCVLEFDGQDSIRKKFEGLTDGKRREQLKAHLPDPVDPAPYRSFALGQFGKYIIALRCSCEYQKAVSSLGSYRIPNEEPLAAPQSVTFDKTIKLDDATPHNKLISEVRNPRIQVGNCMEMHESILTEDDRKDFAIALDALRRIEQRHQAIVDQINAEARVANKLVDAITSREYEQSQVITDAQKAHTAYLQSIDRIGERIANVVMCEKQLSDFSFDFEPMVIEAHVNPVGELQFVCKLATDAITPTLLTEVLDGIINKRKRIDLRNASYESVRDSINGYPEDNDEPLKVLEEKFAAALNSKLRQTMAINRENDDVFQELSRGYNAQMYFALMADRASGDGVYIVDQPEDQISQTAIKKSVLKEFREIANARQVILITHNPQFIVNLDVDNVIFIGKKDGALYIRSGALEYECDEYSMLDTVAENIEGGLDTIQRRMKRYEKAS